MSILRTEAGTQHNWKQETGSNFLQDAEAQEPDAAAETTPAEREEETGSTQEKGRGHECRDRSRSALEEWWAPWQEEQPQPACAFRWPTGGGGWDGTRVWGSA